MKLDPFVSVNDLPFTVTREQVLRLWGRPADEGFNVVGLVELDYGSTVYRFQTSGRLEEVTLQAATVQLGAEVIPFGALRAHVRAHDLGMFERAGFVVSPKFGLAFDPTSDHWVTALAAHCLDAWRAL
ncbi:MAG TPA: hypothetical protein VFY73_03850 [Ideonella sp.]|uniref:hypothetical protein n=1 Tax=Ideonella sp. TaxID=1929293 RepID=UPI002E36D5E4|nr:hypothetical protein [Ideonella sp.]HEX5683149.1 hypothetical protein [Ideonella sp.]